MKKIIGLLGSATLLVLMGILFLHAKSPAIGEKAPNFTLEGIDGKKHSLSDYKGSYVVLEWVNHGCPFVKKHYKTGNMQGLQKEVLEKNTVWISICSSAKGKQGYYEKEDWSKVAKKKEMSSSAVLLDPKGKVGKMYGAKTTPHMYVINPDGNLIYKGAIDDRATADPEDVEGAQNYVKAALDQAQAGEPVEVAETSSYGCSVKY